MSDLSKFATFNEGGDFEIAEAGAYECRLTDIEVVERAAYEDPTKMEPNFIWKFETTKEFDSKDRPYRFLQYTKTSYGNDRAKLTQLLDTMLEKRLTRQEYAELMSDTSVLTSVPWKVAVDESKSQSSGKAFNKIISVRPAKRRGVTVDAPMKPRPKPAVEEAEDDLEDPFK